nr:retrovirus-related Pol polyprotein from transposon TNT 1-94 [Tanacetum cinerariifolium]
GWPNDWMLKYPELGTIGVPHLSNASDMLVWTNLSNEDAKRRSVRSVISKLVFAASCYFIWQERYSRLFLKKKKIRSPDQVIDVIKSTVRLKLLSCRFKKTSKVECLSIAELFFPSLRFFPLGFSWEGFLRRQNRLAVNTPKLMQRDDFEALCTLKWDPDLASLFGKPKYEENLINSIYDTKKKKSLTTDTPLSTAFFSISIVQDLQDSPDDEDDTRSSQEYMNDLELI